MVRTSKGLVIISMIAVLASFYRLQDYAFNQEERIKSLLDSVAYISKINQVLRDSQVESKIPSSYVDIASASKNDKKDMPSNHNHLYDSARSGIINDMGRRQIFANDTHDRHFTYDTSARSRKGRPPSYTDVINAVTISILLVGTPSDTGIARFEKEMSQSPCLFLSYIDSTFHATKKTKEKTIRFIVKRLPLEEEDPEKVAAARRSSYYTITVAYAPLLNKKSSAGYVVYDNFPSGKIATDENLREKTINVYKTVSEVKNRIGDRINTFYGLFTLKCI